MAKASKSDKKDSAEEVVTICRNRRATFDYEISDRIECGVVLTGTEVKSLREGLASLDEAYAKIDNDEVWLLGAEIPEYLYGNRLNHKPKRPRKLLLHRREIAKFAEKAEMQGFTLVPLRWRLRGRPGAAPAWSRCPAPAFVFRRGHWRRRFRIRGCRRGRGRILHAMGWG